MVANILPNYSPTDRVSGSLVGISKPRPSVSPEVAEGSSWLLKELSMEISLSKLFWVHYYSSIFQQMNMVFVFSRFFFTEALVRPKLWILSRSLFFLIGGPLTRRWASLSLKISKKAPKCLLLAWWFREWVPQGKESTPSLSYSYLCFSPFPTSSEELCSSQHTQ